MILKASAERGSESEGFRVIAVAASSTSVPCIMQRQMLTKFKRHSTLHRAELATTSRRTKNLLKQLQGTKDEVAVTQHQVESLGQSHRGLAAMTVRKAAGVELFQIDKS